jgi:hypothetical protein
MHTLSLLHVRHAIHSAVATTCVDSPAGCYFDNVVSIIYINCAWDTDAFHDEKCLEQILSDNQRFHSVFVMVIELSINRSRTCTHKPCTNKLWHKCAVIRNRIYIIFFDYLATWRFLLINGKRSLCWRKGTQHLWCISYDVLLSRNFNVPRELSNDLSYCTPIDYKKTSR